MKQTRTEKLVKEFLTLFDHERALYKDDPKSYFLPVHICIELAWRLNEIFAAYDCPKTFAFKHWKLFCDYKTETNDHVRVFTDYIKS